MKGERKRNDEFGHKIEFEMMLEISTTCLAGSLGGRSGA